jgi:hypothetical protein
MRLAYRAAAFARTRAFGAALALLACAAFPQEVGAIAFGQLDTFQNGTVQGWEEGGVSPNPPTNIATGGPAGSGDRYLQNIATGGSGAGSRMVMFNAAQWTGDYLTQRIDRISAQLANFGSTTLYMRVAIRGGSNSSVYCSASPFILPPDGRWRAADFDLTAAALTNVGGANTLEEVLSNVIEARILSAIGGASFTGDPTAATLGIDNITARDVANGIVRISEIGISSGTARISFPTLPGRSYRVERKNALTDATWVPLSNANNVPGTGSIVQIKDPEPITGDRPKRFYRAVLLPPP